MSVEDEFQNVWNELLKKIQERVDKDEISEGEAENLRDEVYSSVSKVYDTNDSWCESWQSSTEECM